MYRYFEAPTAVGHYLVDKYNKEVNSKREAIVEDLLTSTGSLGVVLVREWGAPAVVQALVFPASHDITAMEGAKTQDHPSGVIVTFEADAPFAGHYYEALSHLNAQLMQYPEFSDWLHHTTHVTRFAFGPEDQDGKHKKLATSSQLLGDGRIVFRVPAGNDALCIRARRSGRQA